MIIRKGKREDLQYLPDLLMRGYRGMEKYGEESIEKARRYIENLYHEDPQCFFVAEDEGEIIGFVFCNRYWYSKFEHGEVGAIHEIVVNPKRTHQGIGKRLIEEAINFLKPRKIELWVGSQNTSAIKFYEKLGFKRKNRVGDWIRMTL